MKQAIALLITALATVWTGAARTAADFFAAAPAEAVPLLKTNTRLDMLDYYNSGLPTASDNSLGGRSRITALSDNALTVELSRDATLQLAVVPAGRDTVVAVIETIRTPMADSGIRLYRASDWRELPAPALPGVREFAPADMRKNMKTGDSDGIFFVRAEYEPESGLFRFTDTTAAYYTDADRPESLKKLRPNITMRLSKGRFIENK